MGGAGNADIFQPLYYIRVPYCPSLVYEPRYMENNTVFLARILTSQTRHGVGRFAAFFTARQAATAGRLLGGILSVGAGNRQYLVVYRRLLDTVVMKSCSPIGLLMGHRLRRWPSGDPMFRQRPVSAAWLISVSHLPGIRKEKAKPT